MTPDNEVHKKLLDTAKTRCLPYLTNRDCIAPYRDRIAFVLVGSVATGLCREGSDIDIALVCDKDVFEAISPDTSWSLGRPTETIIDGTQLHYYGKSYEQISARLQSLDDVYLYVYTHTIVLQDTQDNYAERLSKMLADNPDIRKQRIEGKLDMLLRRSRALTSGIQEGDPVAIANVSLQVITLCLKVIALLDDVPFDPRKHFFKTALSGELGMRLTGDIRHLFNELGKLGNIDNVDDIGTFELPRKLQTITDVLCNASRKQGFSVGLDKPDRRHLE